MTVHEHHANHAAPARKLKLAIILTAAILAAEIIGGLLSHSLALLSDAGHVLTDLVAIALSWWAVKQVEKSATARMTYGYHRIGIIVALVNALSLAATSIVIFYEAARRFQNPEPVQGFLMIGIAAIGLVANLIVVAWLQSESRENLNVKSAFWHAWGDSLSSFGVIAAGVIILFTGAYWVDPAVSVLIGIVILAGAWRLVKQGTTIILEASPEHLDVNEIATAIAAISKVNGVHDLHVWSIAPGFNILSGHLVVEDVPISQTETISGDVRRMLESKFHILHSTLQAECAACSDTDAVFCTMASTANGRHKK